MKSKWVRRGLWAFALLTGAVLGILRPALTQGMLSPVGIVVGIGFFFLLRPDSEEEEEGDSPKPALVILQMLLYFIIGGALGSMILFFLS